jgi:tetrapyrrole methylase family protein/MazG family protein
LTCSFVSKEFSVSRRFDDLVALQQRLLSPGGCPWDREQTHDTLRTYLLEETYEVLDALDSADPAKFSEELGDLLLQIVFHAELARVEGRFDIGDVIESIYLKMVRRHPHVFGDAQATSAADVLKNWEHLKREERRQKASAVGALLAAPSSAASSTAESSSPAPSSSESASLLDGIPKNLPALLQAYQITRRAARIGFDWDRIEGVLDKVSEEARELRETLSQPDRARQEEEVGDLLFAAVNVARFLDLDPELALRKANQKFSTRFRAMEREAAESGRPLEKSSTQEMDALWEQSKKKFSGKA